MALAVPTMLKRNMFDAHACDITCSQPTKKRSGQPRRPPLLRLHDGRGYYSRRKLRGSRWRHGWPRAAATYGPGQRRRRGWSLAAARPPWCAWGRSGRTGARRRCARRWWSTPRLPATSHIKVSCHVRLGQPASHWRSQPRYSPRLAYMICCFFRCSAFLITGIRGAIENLHQPASQPAPPSRHQGVRLGGRQGRQQDGGRSRTMR